MVALVTVAAMKARVVTAVGVVPVVITVVLAAAIVVMLAAAIVMMLAAAIVVIVGLVAMGTVQGDNRTAAVRL